MSPLHNKNALKQAIENSNSIKGILAYLGMSSSGDAYKNVRKWIEWHDLELPKWYRPAFVPKTLEEKLQKGTNVTSSTLLLALVEAGLKTQRCEICNQENIWRGKPLTLHLDHIDGDHDNNLLENLRVLCPHCHQQTPTFGGRNINKPKKKYFCPCGNEKKKDNKYCKSDCSFRSTSRAAATRNSRVKKKYFCKCGNERGKKAIGCNACYLKNKKTMIKDSQTQWPPVEELIILLETQSYVSLAKTLGVSDNAIRKRIRSSGLEVPKRYKRT